MKNLLLGIVALVVAFTLFLVAMGAGWLGNREGPGEITQATIPADVIQDRAAAQKDAAGSDADKQILFGDLHVHSTVSFDAYMTSLPLMSGEGAHPQADACDFARFCSQLDFWSINDHAEYISEQEWTDTVQSIRACNAQTDPDNPDVVAYLGWEWTQVAATAENHYGHKNVVIADLDDDAIPARPIGSGGQAAQAGLFPSYGAPYMWLMSGGKSRYLDMGTYFAEKRALVECDNSQNVRDLPASCHETAESPDILYRKLREWGHRTIVIPHGTTWGFYTPPSSSWDKQLKGDMHDENIQTLMEVYSGHGNSEELRDWDPVTVQADGSLSCPEPSEGYLPSCWQAGEIIRDRCLAEGIDAGTCDARAAATRQASLTVGVAGFLTVPGATSDEWLDAGQCSDCFQPAFNYRPRGSTQYVMALSNFDELDDDGRPRRFRFGFMGSSDNHTARPGTGYKEINRRENTEATGANNPADTSLLGGGPMAKNAEPVVFEGPEDLDALGYTGFARLETERQASFFLTGGLIAAHSPARDRDAIWDSMQRREVYATSGPRILLWFNLLNGADNGTIPMGGEIEMTSAPQFKVRAVGSFKQKPGCPEFSNAALTPERLNHLCQGECYNPSDERRLITRIEIVRIQPQATPGEDVRDLVEDPWRVFDCAPDADGCEVTFSDEDYASLGRDTLYYARAVEEQSDAVNADNLRCNRDDEGNCVSVDICHGSAALTPYEDDCLAPTEQRAWSSPIFVDWPR